MVKGYAGRSAAQETMEQRGEEKAIRWVEGNGWWRMIDQVVSGLAGVDVVTFFVRNPYTCDSAESVAVRIGYQVAQVEPVLKELAEAGLLNALDLGNLWIYELTDDSHRRQILQQYVSWLQEGYHWARLAMDQPPNDAA